MWKGVSYGGAVWVRFLYNDNTTALKAGFVGMLLQENFEKIVSFGAFLFISGSDFVLNIF